MINDEVHEILESVEIITPLVDEEVATLKVEEVAKEESCPTCGEAVYKSGRCTTCPSCGWSTCSI